MKPKVTGSILRLFNENREMQRFLMDLDGQTTITDDLLEKINIFVGVADITNPVEIALADATLNGRILVAYQGDKITLYVYSQSVIAENKPYTLLGSGGTWIAVGGEYVYAGYIYSDVKGMAPGLVPFAGADGKLDESSDLSWDSALKQLSAKNIYTDKLKFNLAPVVTLGEGETAWNPTDGTLDLGMLGGLINQQIGQELPIPAYNVTGVSIPEGTPVYISGRSGHLPEITPARSDSAATSVIFGITTSTFGTVGDDRKGYVTVLGYVRKIKTNYSGIGAWGTTWVTNDRLYVSKTIAGQLTNVEPTVPHHSDVVATVGIVGAVGIGSIFVINEKHYTLEQLTDVNGTPLTATGQFPVWDNVNKYFDFTYNITNYSKMENGTAQGQLPFWDATGGKWVHTETSEIVWDDVNKREGINAATPTERLEIGGNLFLNTDNNKVLLGAGKDFSIYYDGTNAVINPKEVGTGDLSILGRVEEEGTFSEIHAHDNATTQSIPTGATYTKITTLDNNGESSNCTADGANDKITITKAGRYLVNGSFSFTCGTNNVTFFGSAFLNGVEQDNVHFTRKIGTAADIGSASFTGIIDVTTVPWDLDVRFRHDNGGSITLTLSYANLNTIYLGET